MRLRPSSLLRVSGTNFETAIHCEGLPNSLSTARTCRQCLNRCHEDQRSMPRTGCSTFQRSTRQAYSLVRLPRYRVPSIGCRGYDQSGRVLATSKMSLLLRRWEARPPRWMPCNVAGTGRSSCCLNVTITASIDQVGAGPNSVETGCNNAIARAEASLS